MLVVFALYGCFCVTKKWIITLCFIQKRVLFTTFNDKLLFSSITIVTLDFCFSRRAVGNWHWLWQKPFFHKAGSWLIVSKSHISTLRKHNWTLGWLQAAPGPHNIYLNRAPLFHNIEPGSQLVIFPLAHIIGLNWPHITKLLCFLFSLIKRHFSAHFRCNYLIGETN